MTLWLDRFAHDLRHACRVFVKSPGFTAIAVLSIAFGTGANVAMFSAVDALLLRPLPVRAPDELITIGSLLRTGRFSFAAASYPDFVDIRARTRTFRALVAHTSRRAAVSRGAGDAKQIRQVTSVSGNFFDELGIPLHLGRGFRPDEDLVFGRDAVAVLGYGMWHGMYGADPDVIGRDIVIAGTTFRIIGVAAESFTGMDADIATEAAYVPLAMWAHVMNLPERSPLIARELRVLLIKGRLQPGVGLGEARAELDAIGRELERAYPQSNEGQALVARTEFQWRMIRTPVRAGLVMILSILSLAVLCVACANVAGLLTSRAPLRARELAVRLAVGAGRARLIAQLLTESLLIAIAGGIGGLAVGYAGIRLSNQIEFPTDIVAPPVMQLDWRALAFSLAAALGSAIAFGLGPALTTTRIDLASSFRATEPAARRRWRLGGRSQLVALQVALSLVVLTVAAITLQTFSAAFSQGPGFRTTQIAKLTIDAGQGDYKGVGAVQFFEEVVRGARQLPGVTAAAVTSAMPLWGVEFQQIVPGADQLVTEASSISTFANVVDDQYFATMEIPIVRGRAFGETDDGAAPKVAIVNETLARHLWPDADAVGQRFRTSDARDVWIDVVGVARNTTYLYPAEAPMDMVYVPLRQHPRAAMTLLVQTTTPSAELLQPMRDLVQAIDPGVPVYDAQTIERFYNAMATSLANVVLSMITGIALMGIAITMVGLYGLVSFAVSRRTREIGIRMAVGATYARVLRMLLRQGLTPAWIGLGVGMMLSVATARLLPSFVPFSQAYDTRALLGLVPVLLAVTLLAAFVPARRAATVNPSEALRHE